MTNEEKLDTLFQILRTRYAGSLSSGAHLESYTRMHRICKKISQISGASVEDLINITLEMKDGKSQ